MKKLMAAAAVLLAASLLLGSSFDAPGSQEDPVVTKSYLDMRLNEVLDGSSREISEYQMEFIINEITNALSENGAPTDTFTPVNVPEGFILIGNEGTEIILRSGTCEGYTVGISGLVNTTTGEEITNGSKVGANHLLIIPRSDGRGVKCKTDCWFIVKGSYSIR